GLDGAVIHVHQRKGFTPVALAGKEPVAQLVLNLLAADAPLFQFADHPLNGLVFLQTVEEVRIHQVSVADEGEFAPFKNSNHGESKFLSEFKIPLVMAWYGHDGA